MTTTDAKRLPSPLKQVSLDSVHEKNVRHGHISTLHIWPARRPLAASRAALIATLLPDPGHAEERNYILSCMAGKVSTKVEPKRVNGRVVEKMKEVTEGGILHWGRENGPDLDWFRKEIRKAYGGRAPKVLDPFAGGGAIPLEAMRLGCDGTAMDINPVAWFILKCTLEYPQKLAGQTLPLPRFALADQEFMEAFLKAKGFKGARLRTFLERMGHGKGEGVQLGDLSQDDSLNQADLAWHVRAWGRWVLARARKELASFYPTYAEYQPLTPTGEEEQRPMNLLELDENGVAQLDSLNDSYLKNPDNPRWIAKPTVAYLWARTVTCKQCRATLPLLKTRWLCKKDNEQVLLTMNPDPGGSGVVFGVQPGIPQNGGNTAQRREHDKRIGGGTMSRTGATCPCCGAIMTMSDIRLEGRADRLGAVMTDMVVDGLKGKKYRLPAAHEIEVAQVTEERLQTLYADIPFGLPEQLSDYPQEWQESIAAICLPIISRMADRGSTLATWTNNPEKIRSTFARFALPITWDFSESAPLSDTTGGFVQSVDWVFKVCDYLQGSVTSSATGETISGSAIACPEGSSDVILTDPPYCDAIPYSDLMDFFYVWLRRSVTGLSPDVESAFCNPLGPKWDHASDDGELMDDASRFDGDPARSKQNYEDGMARVFQACLAALATDGRRLVVVFANKQPDAWETLSGPSFGPDSW